MGTKSSGKKAKAKKNPKLAAKPSSKKHKKENTATTKTQPPPINKKDKKKSNAPKPKAKPPIKKSKRKEKAAIRNEAHESHSFGSGIGTDMIDFRVGQASKLFRVHKNILDEKAPSFSTRAALLPDVELNIFGLFAEWLYTGEIQQSPMYKGTDPHMERFKLYGFALEFDLAPLMDYTLKEVIKGYRASHSQVSLEDVKYAYTNFPSGPFRDFVLQSFHFSLRCDKWYLDKKLDVNYIAKAGRLLAECGTLGADLIAAMVSNPVRDNANDPI